MPFPYPLKSEESIRGKFMDQMKRMSHVTREEGEKVEENRERVEDDGERVGDDGERMA